MGESPPAGDSAQVLADAGGVLMIMNSLSQGGGDRVAVLLANGFAQSGIPVRIVLLRDAGEPQLRSLLHERVSVISGGAPLGLKFSSKGDGLGHRHLERSRGISLIRRQIDRSKPAVVLGATDNMAFITALVRRPKDQNIVFGFKLTNRLSRPDIGPFRRIYRYHLFKFIFDRLDLVLTLTDAERSHVLSVHPGRDELLRTVPNPYVTREMLSEPRRPRRSGPPRLIAVGRMVPQKRFDVLLRAFAFTNLPEARLTILGGGPLRRSLERLARSLEIAERVDMPGYVGDVAGWLRRSDLLVLSSDYEGLPAVVVEALACNVPVATTESFFAARELLGECRSCAVVPIGDAQALARGIESCLAAEGSERLREIAEPYRVDLAIRAHIDELARAVAAQNRTDTPV